MTLLLLFVTSTTHACSCFAAPYDEMFQLAVDVSAIYIAGIAKVTDTGEYAGMMDDNNNNNEVTTSNVVVSSSSPPEQLPSFFDRDVHFFAYHWFSYKGCGGTPETFEIIVSNEHESLCGVNPKPGWYIMETHLDSTSGHRRMTHCNMRIPWNEFTVEMYQYFEQHKQDTCNNN